MGLAYWTLQAPPCVRETPPPQGGNSVPMELVWKIVRMRRERVPKRAASYELCCQSLLKNGKRYAARRSDTQAICRYVW